MKYIKDPKDRYLSYWHKALNAITEMLKKQVEVMDENGMHRANRHLLTILVVS